LNIKLVGAARNQQALKG